jgi:hypothetical protein
MLLCWSKPYRCRLTGRTPDGRLEGVKPTVLRHTMYPGPVAVALYSISGALSTTFIGNMVRKYSPAERPSLLRQILDWTLSKWYSLA